MTTTLRPDEVARFRRDGYLFPRRVMAASQAAHLLARLERLEQARAGRLPAYANAKPHLLVPWLWDLVHDPAIVEPVAALLGPDLLCYGSSFVDKRPGDGRYVAWHQDATYWGLSSAEAVTAWVALTPSTPASGCVRVLPGSHHEVLPHADSADPRNLLGRRERLSGPVDEALAVDLELAPGEMSLHDVLLVHGSRPNQGGTRRIGFSIRYIPAHVHVARRLRPFATLVRGRDAGHFALEQPPQAEFDARAVERHAAIFRSGMSVIFGKEEGADGR